jgi:osmotically-inducible protein OsmY
LKNVKPLYVLATLLILPGLLLGCAAERKCGLGGCPGDSEITANIQSLINQHTDVGPPNSVHVQTLDHVVYLNGAVSEGNMSRTAEEIAQKTPGVTRVVNNIAVTH